MFFTVNGDNIIRTLHSNGFAAYYVGGCVRDTIMGNAPNDYDIATSATPEQVMELFENSYSIRPEFGTVLVPIDGMDYEITTFRADSDYSDNRHPDSVRFSDSIEEDLARRDFTMNAIAYDPAGKKFIDYYNGVDDINHRVVTAVGNPNDRFQEDALRLMRAVRFAAQKDFTIDQSTFSAIKKNAKLIKNISAERIAQELIKILVSNKPSSGIRLLLTSGLLQHIIPELIPSVGFEQRNHHHIYDVFEHILAVVDNVPADPIIRMAALFHDIGKPASFVVDADGRGHFYEHEVESARLAQTILARLRFSNDFTFSVVHLVENHMIRYTSNWSDSAVRRFIGRIGSEYIYSQLMLYKADMLGNGTTGAKVAADVIEDLGCRTCAVNKKGEPTKLSMLAVNGNDIMDFLGINQGRNVGLILNYLLNCVIDNPAMNTKEILEHIARGYYDETLCSGDVIP